MTGKTIEFERKIKPETLSDVKIIVDESTFAGRFRQDDTYYDNIDAGYLLLSRGCWLRVRKETDRKGKHISSFGLKVPRDGCLGRLSAYEELSSLDAHGALAIRWHLGISKHAPLSGRLLCFYGYAPVVRFQTVRDVYRIAGDPTFTLCVDRTIGCPVRKDGARFTYEVIEVEKIVHTTGMVRMAEKMVLQFLDKKAARGARFTNAVGGKVAQYLKFYEPELYKKFFLQHIG